ncbi:MAG: hypothetical protein WBA41_14225 [Rivularia sp. (in: cyanobacteria)]
MLWKFVVGILVLPCCLGLETASATLRKVQIPAQPEIELLSPQSEEEANVGETIPAINQQDYKISHHRRRDRKQHHYKRRNYQRRNYNQHYRRVNYRDNYQDCPESRRRRVNYRPASYRQEAYPINDMIYRRHYHDRH